MNPFVLATYPCVFSIRIGILLSTSDFIYFIFVIIMPLCIYAIIGVDYILVTVEAVVNNLVG